MSSPSLSWLVSVYFSYLFVLYLQCVSLLPLLAPFLQIIFNEADYKFVLDDGYQQPVSLSSPHREVLAATFYKFLLKNIGKVKGKWVPQM